MLKNARLFPFLVALYPIIHICIFVVGIPPLVDLLTGVVCVLLSIALVVVLARFITSHKDAPFLAAGFSTGWMFSYTSMRSLVTGIDIAGIHLWSHSVLIPLWGGVLIAGLLLAPHRILVRPGMVRYLNTVAALLLVLPVLSGIPARSKPEVQPVRSSPVMSKPADDKNRPDIYFFVMDAYGGQSELQRLLGFSNQEFLDQLGSRGFVVSRNTYSNYPATQLSLAATLNTDYLLMRPVAAHEYGLVQNRTELTQSIENSKVHRYLESAGYSVFDLSIWPEIVGHGRCQEDEANPFLSPFNLELANMTFLAKPLAQNLLVGLIKAKGDVCRFSALPEFAARPGPKFIYLHSMLTHDPYVFDNEGEVLPYGKIIRQGTGDRALYLSQIRVANSMLLAAIDHIRSVSSHRSVIIIQGDHGPALIDPSQDGIEMRHSILNAAFFPGLSQINENLPTSPVNTFRLILNRYVGADFTLLEDRYYSASPSGNLIDTTEKLSKAKQRIADGGP